MTVAVTVIIGPLAPRAPTLSAVVSGRRSPRLPDLAINLGARLSARASPLGPVSALATLMRPSTVLLVLLLAPTVVSTQRLDFGSGSIHAVHMRETPVAMVTRRLLDNYGSVGVRPGVWIGVRDENAMYPTDDLWVQIGIDRFHNLDQLRQLWGLHGYFRAWWNDPRLAYNSTEADTSAIYLTLAESMRVWQPQMYLENAVEWSHINGDDGLAESLVVYPNGDVWRSQQRETRVACEMNLELMPFDTQVCLATRAGRPTRTAVHAHGFTDSSGSLPPRSQTCSWKMGMYTALAHEVHMRWRSGVDAMASWRHACPSGWVPTALRQDDQLTRYPSGDYAYAYAEIDFTRASANTMIVRYLYRCVHLPTSPHISPHLPTPPHTSPHISTYLPASPRISQHDDHTLPLQFGYPRRAVVPRLLY